MHVLPLVKQQSTAEYHESMFRRQYATIDAHLSDSWTPTLSATYNSEVLTLLVRGQWPTSNKVSVHAAGFDRTTTPPSIKVYVEYESPRPLMDDGGVSALAWGTRKCTTRAGTAADINTILKLAGVVENVSPCGPLGPLIATAHRDATEAAASVFLAAGGPQLRCAHARCRTPMRSPEDGHACLSCSTLYCSRRCTQGHFCGIDSATLLQPLMTAVVVRRSPTPLAFTDIPRLFPDFQFGVALEEGGQLVHVGDADVDPMAARVCGNVGMYATFVVSAEVNGKPVISFALAARGTYKTSRPVPSAAAVVADLATVAAETKETAARFKVAEFARTLQLARADLERFSGGDGANRLSAGPAGTPLSMGAVHSLMAAVDRHAADAVDDPAFLIAATAAFEAGLAALLRHQFSLAPHTPAWGTTAVERVGLVFMDVYLQPEHRGYERLHSAACHLLGQICRA